MSNAHMSEHTDPDSDEQILYAGTLVWYAAASGVIGKPAGVNALSPLVHGAVQLSSERESTHPCSSEAVKSKEMPPPGRPSGRLPYSQVSAQQKNVRSFFAGQSQPRAFSRDKHTCDTIRLGSSLFVFNIYMTKCPQLEVCDLPNIRLLCHFFQSFVSPQSFISVSDQVSAKGQNSPNVLTRQITHDLVSNKHYDPSFQHKARQPRLSLMYSFLQGSGVVFQLHLP